MRKPTTGEPYAGEPHVRFGGRGGESLPYPYQPAGSISRIAAEATKLAGVAAENIGDLSCGPLPAARCLDTAMVQDNHRFERGVEYPSRRY